MTYEQHALALLNRQTIANDRSVCDRTRTMPATEFVAGILFCLPGRGRFAVDGVEDGAAQAEREQGVRGAQGQAELKGSEPEVDAPQVKGTENWQVLLDEVYQREA